MIVINMLWPKYERKFSFLTTGIGFEETHSTQFYFDPQLHDQMPLYIWMMAAYQ